MMNKILFACFITVFLFFGVQSSHAGKNKEKHGLPKEEVTVEALTRSMKNLKTRKGRWEPGPPLRKGSMSRIWEEKARKKPNKYKIINNTVWTWKKSPKSQNAEK